MHRQKINVIIENIKKKGGIYIKKINVFLIFIISIFLCNNLVINVKAESAQFYEGEYIDGIYMNKYEYSSKTIYYQKARFFRKSDTNEFAYCLEPFKFFNENSMYQSTNTLSYLNNEQLEKISRLAYYGYGYKEHTDKKWYAITQLMIWQTANPNNGEYYFTNGLNGKKTDIFQNEINELNSLVQKSYLLPSFSNKEYTIVENHQLILEDSNNAINTINIEGENYTKDNNKITINNLEEGDYTYTLKKDETNYKTPEIFYQSNDSQDLLKIGSIDTIETKFTIHVVKTTVQLSKIDKDTKSIIPNGEAILDGAKYIIMDENHNKIEELVINENNAIINNLNFGKYYIKEVEAGKGYTVDNNEYEIVISEKNNKIQLVLENKVIEKKITIEKKFGEENSFYNEKDISFNIFNNKNELINTLTTNEEGIIETILPYGTYTIIQVNTTEGYKKVDPITINVDNQLDETIELKDLKIKVPNTHTNKNNSLLILIEYILFIICLKKYV